jgi:hypothetical protein
MVDGKAFDNALRRLTAQSSRRVFSLATASGLLGAALGRVPSPAQAGKRHKRKNKKRKKQVPLQFNAFACVEVGKPCRGNSANCCSGICQGKKPKKGQKDKSVCVAHNVGICQAGQDFCLGVEVKCSDEGECLTTTGNGSFCGDAALCQVCQKDTDCEALGFGEGAACVVCGDCLLTGGTACALAAD